MAERKYELVFITHPERTDEQLAAITDKVKAAIEKDSGTVDHVEQWGKRKLSYKVKKQSYGYYTLIHFTASPDSIIKLEQGLKYDENVIKWITLNHHPKTMLKPPAIDPADRGNFGDRDRGFGRDR